MSETRFVTPFGIRVPPIEPGGHATDRSDASASRSDGIEACDEFRNGPRGSASARGDPAATRSPILRVVDADPPPLGVSFGKLPFGIAEQDHASRLETRRACQPAALEAHGGD